MQSGRKIPHFFPGIEGFHVIAERLVASCLNYPVPRPAHQAPREIHRGTAQGRAASICGRAGSFLSGQY